MSKGVPVRPGLWQDARVSAPLIGITCCMDRGQKLRAGRDYAYLAQAYVQAVASAGGLPVMIGAPTDVRRLAERLDGLVISGGDDLPTSLTAPEPLSDPTLAEDAERTAWSRELIEAFSQGGEGKPILGVCYGMQLLNLHFGGTLHAAWPEAKEGGLDHGGGLTTTRHGLRQENLLVTDWSFDLKPDVEVTSCHRQAVDQLAPDFIATARASDGVIEAFEDPSAQICGVEWHPEFDATGPVVYGELVRRCHERAAS